VDAESAATASGVSATDSGISATGSELAKGLSEAAKVIAIEEAGKSFVSAGESAASAAASEAAKNQILNKAEINTVTAGNILRADGTLFKSISEVEFLSDYEKFERSPLSIMFPTGSKGPILWGLPNAPYSGQVPSAGFDDIEYPFFCTIQGGSNFSFAVEMLVQFYRTGSAYIYFAIGKDSDNYLLLRIERTSIRVSRKLNAVTTILSTHAFNGSNNTQLYSRITIQFGREEEVGSITSTFFSAIQIPRPVNANNDFNFFGFGANEFSGSNGIEKVVVYGDRIISIP
jgi:hypothetical protein